MNGKITISFDYRELEQLHEINVAERHKLKLFLFFQVIHNFICKIIFDEKISCSFCWMKKHFDEQSIAKTRIMQTNGNTYKKSSLMRISSVKTNR